MKHEKVSPLLPLGAETTTTDSSFPNNLFDGLGKYSSFNILFGLSEEEHMYQEFMSKENSFYSHAVMAAFGTMITMLNVFKTVLGEFFFEYKMYGIIPASMLIPMWLHLYALTQKKYPNSCRPLPINFCFLGDAYLLSYFVSFGLYLYGMATVKGCDSFTSPSSLMCDHQLPFGALVRYICVSILLSVLIKCRHLVVVILVVTIEITVLSIVVSIIEPKIDNIMAIFVVLMAQIFVVFECEHSRRMYLLVVESRSSMNAKIMTENENVVMEMQATELRFLIGNVAHDLKTPLQAFSYELELMKKHSATQEQGGTESILLLESICSFMLMTINRAIDYTKVTSGIKLKPSMETVNVGAVFEWVKMCVAHSVTSKAVTIVVEPFSEKICNCIITDKQWLMENLLCLMSNSVKFTAKGVIRIKYSYCMNSASITDVTRKNSSEGMSDYSYSNRLVSSESCPPPMVLIEVIDDGIGISEEMQPTLFKPFKQAMRRAGGTGLGIYSLSKRVESLGGECGVSSRGKGKSGSRFWFTLPYRPDAAAAASLALPVVTRKAMSLQTQPAPLSEAVCKPTDNSVENEAIDQVTSFESTSKDDVDAIMLVEDSHLIQKTCARSFLREGITVVIANNGLECVEKVLKFPNRYKVLLMDINMPLMDGLEATQRIRQWERSNGVGDKNIGDIESKSRLLIIGVSANSDSESKQEALDAGMDRFISKPLKMSVLESCLAEFGLDLDCFKSL